MKRVTRSHVHIDRVACPWLITRFVDSEAEFLFAPKSRIDEIVESTGAIPFDAPGVELGHRDEKCSFEAIMEKYDLTADKALMRMAQIVRAADTGNLAADPVAAGLEAVAAGYSLRFPDDLENLDRQLDVYDALYAWCRLQVGKSARLG